MISTNQQQVDRKKYDANYEAIFGANKPSVRGSFVQCPITHKLIPRSQPTVSVDAPLVMKPHEDFVSPIDGKVISSRRQLADHNKRHGVTNSADYSEEYMVDRARSRNAAGDKYLKDTRRQEVTHMVDQILNR